MRTGEGHTPGGVRRDGKERRREDDSPDEDGGRMMVGRGLLKMCEMEMRCIVAAMTESSAAHRLETGGIQATQKPKHGIVFNI